MIKTIRENGEIEYTAENAEELLAQGKAASTPEDEVYHPSQQELDDFVNTQYQRDRKYPSIGDQLDALFKAGVFPTEMAEQIQAAKDAHPKPAE
tara:strand:+ start:865 stop:1146 length:282 start_codon:yes stop_codon:yes gene_type:complete